MARADDDHVIGFGIVKLSHVRFARAQVVQKSRSFRATSLLEAAIIART
jgi:hypothetical protein